MEQLLDEETFLFYAMKNYTNSHCVDVLEFNEDLNRIRCVKRLFKSYTKTGVLKSNYILNHLIILYNVFTPEACTRLLVLKLGDFLPILKPFLIYLGYWQDKFTAIGDVTSVIHTSDIQMDPAIVTELRRIETERKNESRFNVNDY